MNENVEIIITTIAIVAMLFYIGTNGSKMLQTMIAILISGIINGTCNYFAEKSAKLYLIENHSSVSKNVR